ncbi:MAG: hypothetical protein F9K19_21830 [Rhizobiaceae bacterium]|nr:MAG: hypothetical protein F9K19_21830 [Rhizobiaceae bacterium]
MLFDAISMVDLIGADLICATSVLGAVVRQQIWYIPLAIKTSPRGLFTIGLIARNDLDCPHRKTLWYRAASARSWISADAGQGQERELKRRPIRVTA